VEFESNVDGNLAPFSHYDIINFPVDSERYDFPISLQVQLQLLVHYHYSACVLCFAHSYCALTFV